MAGFIGRIIEEHKGIRRGLVIWSMVLITYATIRVFSDLHKITGDVVAAYGTATALLSTSFGFYHWQRGKDDNRDVDHNH